MKSASAQPKQRKKGSGGARPNSGRKKKTELMAGPIERIKTDLEEIAPLVGPSLRELVGGIWVEEQWGEGLKRVYQRPPDIRAIQEVLNRIAGKVVEKREVTASLSLTLASLKEIRERAAT